MLQILRQWLAAARHSTQRTAQHSSALTRLGCEPLESRCLLSAAPVMDDGLSGQHFRATLDPPTFAAASPVSYLPGAAGNTPGLDRAIGEKSYSGELLGQGRSSMRPYWPSEPPPPIWLPPAPDPWPGMPPADSGASPDPPPAATTPDDDSMGGYMHLESAGTPATNLDGRMTMHESREVEKVLSALLFVPAGAMSESAAFSKAALAAAIDAALASEGEAGDVPAALAPPEGGMVASLRQAAAPQIMFSQSQHAELETLLEAPARIESSFGRFQAFEVSASDDPTKASPSPPSPEHTNPWPLPTPAELDATRDAAQQLSMPEHVLQEPSDEAGAAGELLNPRPLPRLDDAEETTTLRVSLEYGLAASLALLMLRLSAGPFTSATSSQKNFPKNRPLFRADRNE